MLDKSRDIIEFLPKEGAFLENKKTKIILGISIIFSIIFVVSFFYGLEEFMKLGIANFFTKVGIISFICSLIGYILYAVQHDREKIGLLNRLFYSNTKNVIFFEKYIGTYSLSNIYTAKGSSRLCSEFFSKLDFGQKHVEQVVYGIKDVSNIEVKENKIIIYGDIVMTSINTLLFNQEYLETNLTSESNIKEIDGRMVNFVSKQTEKVEILRGYINFEEFLISKNYPGTEKFRIGNRL